MKLHSIGRIALWTGGFYNPKLVKELEQIKNYNMTVKRLFGVAGVGVEYDFRRVVGWKYLWR